ncbi:hypothetical protein [Aeromonas veronii]
MQGLEAGIAAIRLGGADDVGGGLFVGGAFGNAHDDGDGVDGVGDRLQRFGQGALGASFANGFLHVGNDDRGVEREGGGVGIFRMGDQADHGGGDGADGAGAFVDFDDAHAVVVTVECHGGGSPVSGRR